MTLAALRLRGAFRSLSARPAWLALALLLLAALLYGGYLLTLTGVTWLLDYPMIGTIAPAVIQRSLETLFLVLMATVLFSVLIASIGILYGSDDLELLLGQPVSSVRVFTLKTFELFVNTAGLPLAITVPVLIGVGHAVGAHFLYYPVSLISVVALYALPVTFGALLALVLVRVSPAGRVREVATAVSVLFAAAAVFGFRLLRPERLTSITAMSPEEFELALTTFTRLEIGWLPPAWASNSSWSAISGQLDMTLLALIVLGASGLDLTGLLAHHAYTRGWVRSLDSVPAPRSVAAKRQPRWEKAVAARLGVVGLILVRDIRIFMRDVQQWSQLLVLIALGGVYFVSLAAIPVPTQQFKDVLGTMNIAFIGFLLAGVSLRIAFPSVSFEGASFWLTQVSPVRKRDLVIARFLFNLPIMLVLGLALGLAARFVLDLSPTLALAAPLAAGTSALAMTGLAVGMGASFPKFDYTNPNELVMTPGAIAFMAAAIAHGALTATLIARPAWVTLTGASGRSYWVSAEGLIILGLLLLLTALTTLIPLLYGARQLHRTEY